MVPLRQVASLQFAPAATQIGHYNQERYTPITADVDDEADLGEVVEFLTQQLDQLNWPSGYRYAMGWAVRSTRRNLWRNGAVCHDCCHPHLCSPDPAISLLCAASDYLLCHPACRDWLRVGTLVEWHPFSLTSVVGLISLIGIVINDSIVLVDFANQELRKGRPLLESLKEAGEVRFMPILLTSLTTIGGLIPLTLLGGPMWSAMGWALIGGLTTSTFLILLVVPVLYSLLTNRDVIIRQIK